MQEHEVLVSQSNQILTAIIHGMRQNEPSNHVRLAATTALLNSLEFTRANFDKEVCVCESVIMHVTLHMSSLKLTHFSEFVLKLKVV